MHSSNLYLLTNLCRLELKYTRVSKVPPNLGKLKNLKVVMTSFDVGHGRELGIQRLGELNLDGSLSIAELQNIENSRDALEADLKNKALLVKLTLRWERNENSIDSKKEEDVIENLQPSKNLKELLIIGYGGKQFPNWLLENSLWNMSLELHECESCQCLPPLGVLPFLKALKIRKLDGIVRIDADFHGNNSSSFKSLETLEFSDMSEWEKWECQAVAGAFQHLRQFCIRNCPKLKGDLPKQLFPLEKLQIKNCKELEASAPKALDLELRECGKLQLDWATMKSLTMEASLVETVGSDTLEYLSVSGDCVSLWPFTLDLFPRLSTLILCRFDNLGMISQYLIHNHLVRLEIISCHKLESLPLNMHVLLPSLKSLSIEYCPRLESFPDGGLPSNLESLTIAGCSLKGALGDCSSFPDEGLLPPSLTSLSIHNCPNLEKLDYKGLYQLLSLKTLALWDCPNLQGLPEEGLPKSISRFEINNCPLLKQHCEKEGGEDWEKIAHIETLEIN